MSSKARFLLGLSLLLAPTTGQAGYLIWEYPLHNQAPQQWTLTQTYISPKGTSSKDTKGITPAAHAQCKNLPGYQDGKTWCWEAPCAPGIYLMEITADGRHSENPDSILYALDDACQIQEYQTTLQDTMDRVLQDPQQPAATPEPATPAPAPPVPDTPAEPVYPFPEAPATPQPRPTTPPSTIGEEAFPALAKPVTAPTPGETKPQAPTENSPPSTPPPGDNLIPRPTFEAGWDAGGFAGTTGRARQDTTGSCNGQPALLLTGDQDYIAFSTSQRFTIDPQMTYRLEAWVTLDAITKFIEVDIFWQDATGQELQQWGEAIGGRLSGTRDCTPLTGTIQPPAAARSAVIQVRVLSREGRAWVSGLALTALRASQPSPLPAATAPPQAGVPLPPEQDAPAGVPQTQHAMFAQLLDEFQAIRTAYTTTLATIRQAYTTTLAQQTTDADRRRVYQDARRQLREAYQQVREQWRVLLEVWKMYDDGGG